MKISRGVALVASVALALSLNVVMTLAGPPANAAALTFASTQPVTFANTGPVLGNPSPSQIPVSGATGFVTDVNVTVHGLTLGQPSDLDMELVGPNGAIVPLMSDTCGGPTPILGRNLTFDDEAAASLRGASASACDSDATWKPTDLDHLGLEEWLLRPTAAALTAFDGIDPNGAWSLSLGDDTPGNTGSINGGWSLEIATSPTPPGEVVDRKEGTQITFANSGPALGNPSPSQITVSGARSVVTDVNVTVRNLTHQSSADLDIELVGPNGAIVPLMSDACGSTAISSRNLTFDDEALVELPGFPDPTCNSDATWKPIDFESAGPEEWLLPPTSSTLASFDGIDPNGAWFLSLGDDTPGNTGSIGGGWSLNITTAPAVP